MTDIMYDAKIIRSAVEVAGGGGGQGEEKSHLPTGTGETVQEGTIWQDSRRWSGEGFRATLL